MPAGAIITLAMPVCSCDIFPVSAVSIPVFAATCLADCTTTGFMDRLATITSASILVPKISKSTLLSLIAFIALASSLTTACFVSTGALITLAIPVCNTETTSTFFSSIPTETATCLAARETTGFEARLATLISASIVVPNFSAFTLLPLITLISFAKFCTASGLVAASELITLAIPDCKVAIT